jgi:hypothetical protein
MRARFKSVWSVLIAAVVFSFASVGSSQDPNLISPDGIKLRAFSIAGPNGETGPFHVGDTIQVTISLLNTTANPITFGPTGMFVGCRLGNVNHDFGHKKGNSVLQHNGGIMHWSSLVLPAAGTWELWPAYQTGGHWGPYKWAVKTITVEAAPPPQTNP